MCVCTEVCLNTCAHTDMIHVHICIHKDITCTYSTHTAMIHAYMRLCTSTNVNIRIQSNPELNLGPAVSGILENPG